MEITSRRVGSGCSGTNFSRVLEGIAMLLTVAIFVAFMIYLFGVRSDAQTRSDMTDSAESKYGVTIKVIDDVTMSIDGAIRGCIYSKVATVKHPVILCEGMELVSSRH